ncbi:hypothetical protein SteCoe_32601 [Stentor coeruleus]|uniref:Uncharacterized protein n=1 Tax=Stentor coeruleus TaxID=5963 RepID=A0A1R2AYP3_9CILI|nr:hypothetical protein SteCoe_32601 [Stentor coeruleus]
MNIQDFESGQKNLSGLNLSFTPKDSRACAGAMRALQDKLKQTEQENIELKDKIIVIEGRMNNDREKWQIRLIEEIEQAKAKEETLQKKLQKRENHIQNLEDKLKNIEEHIQIKENQCKYSESETKRSLEQYNLDIESLNIQIELLQKSLNDKQAETKNLYQSFEKHDREKALLEEELKQEKRINQSLQAEVDYLRENSEHHRLSLQKNFETIEQELTKQNTDFQQKIKELEIKNKSLRDMNNNQTKQIDHLKKEIAEFVKTKKQSDEQKIDDIKSKTLEANKRVSGKTQTKPIRCKSPNKNNSVNIKKQKSECELKESVETEDDVRKQVFKCENELEKLNQVYKSLLCLSCKENEDLATVRKDMSKIADEIDKKSEELYEFKKKQQQFLRAKLII